MIRRAFFVCWSLCLSPAAATDLEDRLEGLLLGSLIGDATGGPVEFVSTDALIEHRAPVKAWKRGEKLDSEMIRKRARALKLVGYSPLRPKPEPYAHWTANAAAGTVTDDSRHKFFVLHAIKSKGRQFKSSDLARAYLAYENLPIITSRPDYQKLHGEWLVEYLLAARWVLGERAPNLALPLERLWGGVPTNAGQMALLPIACLYPGEPGKAYRHAYDVGFMDVGMAKDLNASIVAGLAAALTMETAERTPTQIHQELRNRLTAADPFRYGKVPWVTRPIERWLTTAERAVAKCQSEPARLFESLNETFRDTIKWEAQVPVTVAFAAMILCEYDPLASLQLTLEFGHDTDSYAQLAGAFLGALYGRGAFPASMRAEIKERLRLDYDESVSDWITVIREASSP